MSAHHNISIKYFAYSLYIVLSLGLSPLPAAEEEADSTKLTDELLELSLEDLLAVEVTSVAKKRQTVGEAPAAIFVITADDIRRSGASHIGELLRTVPGLNVAQLNTFDWRVAARGSFNGVYPNKLLVLIDGRSMYAPQLSAVFWDVVEVPLEDIARVEVIRGPGGTLWGANAVNGVINIITKSAADTQGPALSLQSGDTVQNALVRQGGKLANGAYRVYAKTAHTDNFPHGINPDTRHFNRVGFRFDSDTADSFTLQGDLFAGNARDTDMETFGAGYARTRGGNLLGRLNRRFSEHSNLTLQAYFDHNWRERASYGVLNQVLDFEIQHQYGLSARHDIIWGLGYRHLYSNVSETSAISRDPLARRDNLFSLLIQDDITLSDKLKLIIGSKFEHNDYTGFEYQPNLRLLWAPSADLSLWSALSRAVRTPSQVSDHVWSDLETPAVANPFYPIPVVTGLRGNPDMQSETALVWEFGARGRQKNGFAWDATLFFGHYEDVTVRENTLRAEAERILLLGEYANGMDVDTHGVELALGRHGQNWRMQLAYTWLAMHATMYPEFQTSFESVEGETPTNQFSLHAAMQPASAWDIGVWLRYVEGIGSSAVEMIPAYIATDLRVAWQAGKDWEFSLRAQNLFDDGHPEYGFNGFYPHVTEIPRSVYAQVRWGF